MSGIVIWGRRVLGISAVLLTFIHPAASQTQEVEIRIKDRPELTDEKEQKSFAQLSAIITTAVSYGLGPDYAASTNPNSPNYRITFEVGGPFNGCVWQILCMWRKTTDDALHNCWTLPVQFSYCSIEDTAAAISKINCLGQLVTFSGAVLTPGSDPCAAVAGHTAADEYMRAYIYCLQFNIDDVTWSEQQKSAIQLIPQEIDMLLDDEFNKRGYDLVPANCPSDDSAAQDVDLKIWGSIREAGADALYVKFVVIVNPGVSSELKNVFGGNTEEIAKQKFREKLGETIINHISNRLRETFGGNQ